MRWWCDKSLASHQALSPGRVPHVRGLSRTWVEYDLFPMLSTLTSASVAKPYYGAMGAVFTGHRL